jgi:hypothetical protein
MSLDDRPARAPTVIWFECSNIYQRAAAYSYLFVPIISWDTISTWLIPGMRLTRMAFLRPKVFWGPTFWRDTVRRRREMSSRSIP